MQFYYSLIVIFIFLFVIILDDPNVGIYIGMVFKIISVNIQRFFWMLRFHPLIASNPVSKWWMLRKYMKEAIKMKKEMEK